MKSTFLAATALLITASMAIAQAPAPGTTPESAPAAPATAKPVRKPAVRPAPAAAPAKPAGTIDVTQIITIRQIDPATFEIDAITQGGAPVNLRMNAFVMQDLGRRLGTFGR